MSRYNQILDESSSTGKKLTNFYAEHNIQLRDQNGQLRSFYDVGKDVAGIWNELSDNERKYYLNIQAGANQSQNLAALMRNYGTAVDATSTALNSAGSASRENAKYLDSLEGNLQNLKSAWEDFSRKLVNSDMVKNTLKVLTKLLEFATTDMGMLVIKGALFAGVLRGIGSGVKALSGMGLAENIGQAVAGMEKFVGAGSSLKYIDGGFRLVGKSAASVGGSLSGVGSTMLGLAKSAGIWGAAIAAVGIAVGVTLGTYGKYVAKHDKFLKGEKEAIKAAKEYKRAQEEVQKTEQRVSEIKSEISTLEAKKSNGNLSVVEKDRLKVLQQQLKVQERQLEIQRETERVKFEKSQNKLGKKGLTSDDFARHAGQTSEEVWSDYGVNNKTDRAVYMYNKSLETTIELKEKAAKAQKKYDKMVSEGASNEDLEKQQKRVTKANNKYTESLGEQSDRIGALLKEKQKYIDTYGSEKNIPKNLKTSYKNLNKVLDDYSELSGLSTDEMIKGSKAILKYGKGAGKFVKEANGINKVNFDGFSSAMTNAGHSAEETLWFLKQIGEEDPTAEVTIDGVDYAIKDLKILNGELQTTEGKKVKTSVTVNNQASDKLKGLGGNTDLGTATKKVKVSGYDSSLKKLQKLRDKNDLGTAKKTIITEHKTIRKAGGTKNFYAKGTDNAVSGNATVNEQGFEIIRDAVTGAMRIANGGLRGDTFIGRGDAVYTHGQSMRMLQKAGMTQADLLQGKSGDIPVIGVSKLEGFKKGKAGSKVKKQYESALATLEYQKDFYNWTDAEWKQKYTALWNKYKGKLGTGSQYARDYNLEMADINRGYAQKAIDDTKELFDNQQKTYAEMTKIVNDYYKSGKINAEEYADYMKEINEQMVSNTRSNYSNQWDYLSQYIQRQIDLEEKENSVLEAKSDLLTAQTQKVKVYREGQGFVYEADAQAVREAQSTLSEYTSVWEEIQNLMDDVEAQVNLKNASVLAGNPLVEAVLGAGNNIASWKSIIGLIGSNMGAYELGEELGIIDPSKITEATTINGQTFNINKIDLPNVVDANEFVSQLQGLATQAIQSSNTRG